MAVVICYPYVSSMAGAFGYPQNGRSTKFRGRHGRWKEEGGGQPPEGHPPLPTRGLGPPPPPLRLVCLFPSGVVALSILYKKIQQTIKRLLGVVQHFPSSLLPLPPRQELGRIGSVGGSGRSSLPPLPSPEGCAGVGGMPPAEVAIVVTSNRWRLYWIDT